MWGWGVYGDWWGGGSYGVVVVIPRDWSNCELITVGEVVVHVRVAEYHSVTRLVVTGQEIILFTRWVPGHIWRETGIVPGFFGVVCWVWACKSHMRCGRGGEILERASHGSLFIPSFMVIYNHAPRGKVTQPHNGETTQQP